MSILQDSNPTLENETLRLGEAADVAGRPPEADIEGLPTDETGGEEEATINPLMAAASGFLATAGVGWMLGGIFSTWTARGVGILGAAIGAGLVWLSYRLRIGLLRALALPITLVVGIGLVAGTGAGTNPVSLVTQAIQAGGLSQPPVAFDPGWRLLLLLLTETIAVAASLGAISLNRSRLAALVPAPVIIAGVLLQPPANQLISVLISVVLAVAALAVAYGSDLAKEQVGGTRFEIRRLGKAGGLLAVILAAVIGMSQLGFLYPPQNESTVIPPKRPQTPPPAGNHLLFTAAMATPMPLRTGELDVYDGTAWLTPPYDPRRLVPVTGANLPAFASDRSTGAAQSHQPTPGHSVQVKIKIADLGEQRQVPDLAEPYDISNPPDGLSYDPRGQTLQTAGRPENGLTYTVLASSPPTAAALSNAGAPPAAVAAFLQVPAPPAAVKQLLSRAPTTNLFDRLQYVRTYFFAHAVAAGPGNPVDVPPARVAAILGGSPASPYEIAASEALLARWAGVPARIGYGYYNDTPTRGTRYDIYPQDGRMWLEAYFTGTGWVPILGQPAHAQANLDQHPQKPNPQVRPNGEIIAQLYIPLRQQDNEVLYTLIQYWLIHGVLPVAAPVLFVWLLLPGLAKLGRRLRRQRWANRLGPRERIAVAYAEFRDRAIDFNVGHPTLTPLEFLDITVADDQHTQLAWIVSRGLWGDLRRDLTDDDAEDAEALARSMVKRLTTAQPMFLRVAAFVSRVSLRDPYSSEIPNLWWASKISRGFADLRQAISPRAAWRNLRRARFKPAAALAAIVGVFGLSGCVAEPNMSPNLTQAAALPAVPTALSGYKFENQPEAQASFAPFRGQALVSTLSLYAIRQKGVAVGTLQTAAFKPGLRSYNDTVRQGVIETLGGAATIESVGGQKMYVANVNQLRLLVSFSSDGQTYELLAADPSLAKPDQLFADLLNLQRGVQAGLTQQGQPPTDVRQSL